VNTEDCEPRRSSNEAIFGGGKGKTIRKTKKNNWKNKWKWETKHPPSKRCYKGEVFFFFFFFFVSSAGQQPCEDLLLQLLAGTLLPPPPGWDSSQSGFVGSLPPGQRRPAALKGPRPQRMRGWLFRELAWKWGRKVGRGGGRWGDLVRGRQTQRVTPSSARGASCRGPGVMGRPRREAFPSPRRSRASAPRPATTWVAVVVGAATVRAAMVAATADAA